MLPRITHARHTHDFELELAFSDGAVARLDFRPRIAGRGGVFAALQQVDFLAQVAVDQEAGTVVWPNGVDFCPVVLFSAATGVPLAALDREADVAC